MVPRKTWRTSSRQWASTFASGVSSLSRPRRLADHTGDSGPPSSRGKIRRELPSLTREHREGKKEGKIFKRGRVMPRTIDVRCNLLAGSFCLRLTQRLINPMGPTHKTDPHGAWLLLVSKQAPG